MKCFTSPSRWLTICVFSFLFFLSLSLFLFRLRLTHESLQTGRCVDLIRSGYMEWHEMSRHAFYVKWMRIRRQPPSSGHSTIRPKPLICRKMDLKNIRDPHLVCSICQSRFVSNYYTSTRLILLPKHTHAHASTSKMEQMPICVCALLLILA